MAANQKPDTEAKISSLWVVVMFNMLAADILSLYIPGAHDEMIEFAGGTPITQLMLVGAIFMEIPIVMIFLSRVLKYGVNRWVNIIASVITIVYVIGGGSTYPHYILFASVETICMLLIIWFAIKWPKPE